MSYDGIGFVNDNPPAINAENLNKMDNELVFLDKENVNRVAELNGMDNCVYTAIFDLDGGTLNIPGSFTRGTILNADGSAYTDGYLYRIVMPNTIKLSKTIRIRVKNGYAAIIATFDNVGALIEVANIFSSTYYDVVANTSFRVCIRKSPENVSELADIALLYSNAYIGTSEIHASLDELETENNKTKSALNDLENCSFTSIFDLDNGTLNIPATFTRGTILNADGSAYTDGYNWRIVMPNTLKLPKNIRIKVKDGYSASIALFDGNGDLVEIANINSSNYYIVYANNSFRIGVRKSPEDSSTPADVALFYSQVYIESEINQRISAIEKSMNLYVGRNKQFSKIKDVTEYIANNNLTNVTVYVDAGNYDLVSEYGSTYLDSIPDGSNTGYGPHVGNNTHFIFAEGANVIFDYEGTNPYCADFFSAFNVTGSVTFENANIKVKNARYCVHEDLPTSASTIPDNTTVKYINCIMEHQGRTLELTGNHSAFACIGGGCNKNTLSIVLGGTYKNPNNNWIYPISYHNYEGADKSRIILNNVWMNKGIRLAQLSTHTSEVNVEISGCYMPGGIQKSTNTDTYFHVTQWNNVGLT